MATNINQIDWQTPNKTEKECWSNLLNSEFTNHEQYNYVNLPWANIIELVNDTDKTINDVLSKYNYDKSKYISGRKTNVTTFQSYHIHKYVKQLKDLNINVIFSPHITKEQSISIFTKHQVLILPVLLYPIITPNYDMKPNIKMMTSMSSEYEELTNSILQNETCYYVSFIGNINYNNNPHAEQCVNIRMKIVNYLNENKNITNYCKTVNEWHFNQEIYGKQLSKIKTCQDKEYENILNEINYDHIMRHSKYVLCPLGIGPNSIRFSETIMYNNVPILISDNMWYPREDIFNKCCIRICENSDLNLKDLDEIDPKYILDAKQYLQDLSNPIKEFINNETYILLTQLYFETNKIKRDEMSHCILLNIENKLIEMIVIFFETIEIIDCKEIYKMYPQLKHPKVVIEIVQVKIPKSININRIIEYSNRFIGSKCIISNNDIYYDHTLALIKKGKLLQNNEIVCLTRTNVFEMKSSTTGVWQKHDASQDTWIYTSPIKSIKNDVYLGWLRSDNLFAGELYRLGYRLSNPTNYINAFHYQHDNVTNASISKNHIQHQTGCMRVGFSDVHEISKCSLISNSYPHSIH